MLVELRESHRWLVRAYFTTFWVVVGRRGSSLTGWEGVRGGWGCRQGEAERGTNVGVARLPSFKSLRMAFLGGRGVLVGVG